MKILLGSHYFAPSTGGIETTSELLAREFLGLGHEVRVITQSKGEDGNFPFPVIRRPGVFELFRQVRWCDVFLQNNISLRTMWPLLFIRRPLFVTHQTWIADVKGRVGWQHRLKLFVLRYAKSFAISRAIADRLPVPARHVGNPYDDEIFTVQQPIGRKNDLIFVGRLVSDKGVDILIDALAIMHKNGMSTHLVVVGEGPERQRLQERAAKAGLQSSIDFVGRKSGSELVDILNSHLILVVPSRWQEPFGVVAVEAIACGCIVVGSEGGGLPEAIGRCGVTFPSGDSRALAENLTQLLQDSARCATLRSHADSHLEQFRKRNVAKAYLDAITAGK